MEDFMKWRFAALVPVILALSLFALPLRAQTTDTTTQSAGHPWYDISKEITVTGTVTNVMKQTTREMRMPGGSHLIVETGSGAVDASLGKFALRGKNALSVTAGQSVQITGVLKTVNNQQVLFARLVQTNGRVYTIRNEHGFVYQSTARDGSESKGGQL
jgi:hypothetical protein